MPADQPESGNSEGISVSESKGIISLGQAPGVSSFTEWTGGLLRSSIHSVKQMMLQF